MTDLKTDQWQAALEAAKAHLAEHPFADPGYNESQKALGGPIVEDGVMT